MYWSRDRPTDSLEHERPDRFTGAWAVRPIQSPMLGSTDALGQALHCPTVELAQGRSDRFTHGQSNQPTHPTDALPRGQSERSDPWAVRLICSPVGSSTNAQGSGRSDRSMGPWTVSPMHEFMHSLTDPLTHAGRTDVLAHGWSDRCIDTWTVRESHLPVHSRTDPLTHGRSDRRTSP